MTFEELQPTLIGLSEQEAKSRIELAGYKIRVIRRDKIYYTGTRDYRLDRVNLSFDNSKLTSAAIG